MNTSVLPIKAVGSRFVRLAILFLLLNPLTGAFAQSSTMTLAVINTLKGPLSSGLKSAVPDIKEPGPFIDSVQAYLNGDQQKSMASFLDGLIKNDITDAQTVERILSTIENTSTAASTLLTLTGGNAGAIAQIQSFVTFISGSHEILNWSDAVTAGDQVALQDGKLEVSKRAPLELPKAETKVQRHANEVAPVLNIIHGVPGATVYLDDDKSGVSKYDQYTFQNLTFGKHVISVRTDSQEGTVEIFVNPNRKPEGGYDEIKLDMVTAQFTLKVSNAVYDAHVLVDGDDKGKVPFSGQLDVGKHKILVRSEWMDDYSQTVTGKSGQAVLVVPTSKTYGALELTEPLPESATLLIDGKPATKDGLRLAPGKHSYKVVTDETPQYRPASASFVVFAGQKAVVPTLIYRVGILQIPSLPFGANLKVDDQALGSPVDWAGSAALKVGDHVLVVENLMAPDSAPVSTKFHIKEGQATQLEIPVGKIVFSNLPKNVSISLGKFDLTKSLTAGDGDTLLSQNLPAGAYEVDYDGVSVGRAAVEHGKTTTFSLSYKPAFLKITGLPSGLQVSLGDKNLDPSKVSDTGDLVIPGTYDLVVSSPAGQKWERTQLEISSGGTYEFAFSSLLAIIPFQRVQMSGKMDDWKSLAPIFGKSKNKGDASSGGSGTEILAGWVYHDAENLYIRFDLDGQPVRSQGTYEVKFFSGKIIAWIGLSYYSSSFHFFSAVKDFSVSGGKELFHSDQLFGTDYRIFQNSLEFKIPLSLLKSLVAKAGLSFDSLQKVTLDYWSNFGNQGGAYLYEVTDETGFVIEP